MAKRGRHYSESGDCDSGITIRAIKPISIYQTCGGRISGNLAVLEPGEKYWLDYMLSRFGEYVIESREVFRGQCNKCGLIGDWTEYQEQCDHCEAEDYGFKRVF